MYVWRIPFFDAAAITVSIVVLLLCAGLLHLRAHVRTRVTRGILSAGVVVAVLSCPVLFVLATEPALAAARAYGRYIDLGVESGLESALLVVVVLIGSRFLFPERPRAHTTFRWRLAFAVLVIGFVTLNLANWCSPGWCERFGFPFPYSWWSDAIVIFDGQNLSAGRSLLAGLADIFILSLGVAGLSLRYRRTYAQPAAPPNSA